MIADEIHELNLKSWLADCGSLRRKGMELYKGYFIEGRALPCTLARVAGARYAVCLAGLDHSAPRKRSRGKRRGDAHCARMDGRQ